MRKPVALSGYGCPIRCVLLASEWTFLPRGYCTKEGAIFATLCSVVETLQQIVPRICSFGLRIRRKQWRRSTMGISPFYLTDEVEVRRRARPLVIAPEHAG